MPRIPHLPLPGRYSSPPSASITISGGGSSSISNPSSSSSSSSSSSGGGSTTTNNNSGTSASRTGSSTGRMRLFSRAGFGIKVGTFLALGGPARSFHVNYARPNHARINYFRSNHSTFNHARLASSIAAHQARTQAFQGAVAPVLAATRPQRGMEAYHGGREGSADGGRSWARTKRFSQRQGRVVCVGLGLVWMVWVGSGWFGLRFDFIWFYLWFGLVGRRAARASGGESC